MRPFVLRPSKAVSKLPDVRSGNSESVSSDRVPARSPSQPRFDDQVERRPLATRMRENPAFCNTSASRAGPAWAPSTSRPPSEIECAQQISVEPAVVEASHRRDVVLHAIFGERFYQEHCPVWRQH